MTTECTSEKIGLVLKGENTLPVVLHADDDPAILLCLVVEDQHREPRALPGLSVFQHLLVTGRVAERGRPAADYEVDALRLAGVVVVEQELGLLGQERLAVLFVAILRAPGGANHLLGRDPVHPLGVDAHEVLAAAGDDVGLEPVVTQILQDFLHRLIRQLSVEPVPARMLGGRDIPGIWLISHLLDESQRWPALRGRRSTMAVGPGRGSGRPALRPAGPRYGGVTSL